MANRVHWEMQHRSREVKIISGIIKVVGAVSAANNVVTLESLTGDGVTGVARTGAGAYRITLDDGYPQLNFGSVVSGGSTDLDRICRLKTWDTKTNKYVDFTVNVAAAPTDVANGVTEYYFFELHLKNSAVR